MPNWHKIKIMIRATLALRSKIVSVAFKSFYRAILRLTSLKRDQDDLRHAQNDFLIIRLTRTRAYNKYN